MKITEATKALKVGDFILRSEKGPNKIKVKYLDSVSNERLTDSSGRVYLLVVENNIKKIGGSMSKGGIKATMSFYESSQQGGPSLRSFAIHLLIEVELKKKNNVEVWVIQNTKVLTDVNGLSSAKKIEVAAFKESEDLCKQEYQKKMKRFPDWNFQENNEQYPLDLQKKYRFYMDKRLSKKT